MSEKINVSQDQLAEAFTEWDRRWREEPERFMSEARHLLFETPHTYGQTCAPYLIKILTEQGTHISLALYNKKKETEMRIEIESTEKIVELDGVPARVWEGHTNTGIEVHCFVTRISPQMHENIEQFEQELKEQKAPSPEVEAYPLRMVL